MEIYHKIENINGINQTVIYVNYPDEYEFSLDINSIKKNVANVADKIREYALKNVGKISDNTALLVLNGIVLGTLAITQLTTLPKKEIPQENVEIVQVADNIEEKTDDEKVEETEA